MLPFMLTPLAMAPAAAGDKPMAFPGLGVVVRLQLWLQLTLLQPTLLAATAAAAGLRA
jgi:hypothetical protein